MRVLSVFGLLVSVALAPSVLPALAQTADDYSKADTVYPRIEVLFSGAAIHRKRAFEKRLSSLVANLKPPRAVETNWRPAASDDMVREELEPIAGALSAKETK